MEELITDWLQLQTKLKDNITTFLRIQVDQSTEYPLRAGGLFYGNVKDLKTLLKPLLDKFKDLQKIKKTSEEPKDFKTIRPKPSKKTRGLGTSPMDILSLADAFNYDTFDTLLENLGLGLSSNKDNKCKVAPPNSTCDAPHPHKVSSAFSNGTGLDYYKKVARKVTKYYKHTDRKVIDHNFVRSYMTFHTLGGNIKQEPKGKTSFAFRDREFLMQFQSWWNHPKITKETQSCFNNPKWQDGYINWVKNFRKKMCEDNTAQGAFINFVDKDIPANNLEDLLRVYYGDKLGDLIEAKKMYDPQNFFHFQMSIPAK